MISGDIGAAIGSLLGYFIKYFCIAFGATCGCLTAAKCFGVI